MRRDEAAEKEEQRILEQSEIEMHQETGNVKRLRSSFVFVESHSCERGSIRTF